MAATEAKGGAALSAFTAAALALPGLAPEALADVFPLGEELDTAFSRYEESGGRIRVDVYQAAASLPAGERLSIRANGVKDVVTGASPAGNLRGADGKAVQILFSASIRDVRDAVDLSASYALDEGTLGVDVARSNENDYTSNFFNLDGRWDLNHKLKTLPAGAKLRMKPQKAGVLQGTFTWKPKPAQAGQRFPITFTVRDSYPNPYQDSRDIVIDVGAQ